MTPLACLRNGSLCHGTTCETTHFHKKIVSHKCEHSDQGTVTSPRTQPPTDKFPQDTNYNTQRLS